LAKQMSARSDDRSQQMLSLPTNEHVPAANDRHPWSPGDVLLLGLRHPRQKQRQGGAVEGAEPTTVPGMLIVLLGHAVRGASVLPLLRAQRRRQSGRVNLLIYSCVSINQ
jgi:hypothetical protein